MWNQIKQRPWAVAIAALIHLLLLAFFVVGVDWHHEVGETAEAVEAEMIGDPQRIAEIQKQMENPPPSTPEQLREEQRLEEERQAQIAKQQRLQEEQRQAEQKQLEEEQRLADIKQQEEVRLAEEKIKAEQAALAEKERKRQAEVKRKEEAEKEKQHQAELKRKEQEKQKQRQAELKRKEQEKQKKIAEEKRRKEEEQQLREAEKQAEAARLAGAMEAEEAAISAAKRSSMIKQWENAIKLRVRSKWLEPPGGASGECRVAVIQARTGTVLDVQVIPSPSCDSAMQKSVARAVRRADPLPRPKDPSIFDGRIDFIFKPER